VEVDQKSSFNTSQPQIAEELGLVNWCKLFDSFDLNDHFAVDYEIRPKSQVDDLAVVFNSNPLLLFHGTAGLSELVREKILVDRLKQSRAKYPVNGNCPHDYLPGKEIFVFVERPHEFKLSPSETPGTTQTPRIKSKRTPFLGGPGGLGGSLDVASAGQYRQTRRFNRKVARN
jgi:hypothetical protein